MVSCSNLFDPPVEKPAAGELQAKGTGRVRVLITEGSAGVRTLLPETPVFSTYQISFTNGSATDTMTIIPAALGPVATYLDLAVGTWTLGVTGYATFNSAEYAAAYGERTGIIVENGITIDVAVTIRPIAVNTVGAAKGIFTYTIDFPSTGISDAKIDLTPVGTGTAQSIDILAARGVETSVEVVPGYYDVFITMQNSAGKTAGAYTAAHIYPGLETKAEYAFTEVDFVSEVYLAGTVSNGDAGMTIKAYSDAARITPLTIGTVDNANAWFIKIPISCPKAYFTISDGATTFNAGDSGSTDIPQNGRSGITLWFPYFYVSQGGDDTNGTGSKGNPFGSVQMAVDAVNTAYTSGNWPSGESALINISGEAKATTTGGTDGLVVINGDDTVYPPITLKGYDNGTYTTHSINATGLSKRVLYINNGANVTMENLMLTGGSIIGDNGGGVTVSGTNSAFTMLSGSISGNAAGGAGGGGVFVSGSSAFTMSGGTIGGTTTNTATNGGGVYIASGTFTMSGTSVISGNTATSVGGGVYVTGSSTFTMSTGTTISGNTANYGAGVFCNSTDTDAFTMTGGTIGGTEDEDANTAVSGGGGGVYFSDTGTFTMSGTATITGNKSNGTSTTVGGGGVYIGSGTFTMSDMAVISDNESASHGGGVYVKNSSTFTMESGTISGNKASSGGGVYFGSTGTFTMSGGTMSGNTATSAAGGVYYGSNGGAFTMSGSAVIAQNNDVYLPNTKQITINGTLTPSGSEYAAKLTPQTYPAATETVNALTVGTGGTAAQLQAAALKFTVTPSGTTNYYVDADGKIRSVQTVLVPIPAGTITGSSAYVYNTNTGVFIAGRTVTLSVYSMATYETTYELWYTVRQWAVNRTTNPYTFSTGMEGNAGTTGAPTAEGKTKPVTTITWGDIIVWCNAYSELTGLTPVYTSSGNVIRSTSAATNPEMTLTSNGYRLPTEAEWENAARGGVGATNYAYQWAGTNTESVLNNYAWFSNGAGGDSGSTTHPVGEKLGNSLGLFDMSGNVCEWCWDWYNATIDTGSVTDPTGPSTGSLKVHRGGSTDNNSSVYLRLVYRNSYGSASSMVGFRVARSGS